MLMVHIDSYFYVVLLHLFITKCVADFVYPDFNQTTGLVFNGNASTTSCVDFTELDYGYREGDADIFNGSEPVQRWETISLTGERTEETSRVPMKEQDKVAVFGTRDNYTSALTYRCPVRLRLTPSHPSTVGSVWFRNPVPVLMGFSTWFTFQISDHSRVCTLHKDPAFSLLHHTTCSVHGGDGFAFVIHGDPLLEHAIGNNGDQLGYGGIQNSVAFEFDTWYNANSNSSDLIYDHISIHTNGASKNTAYMFTELSPPRQHNIGDGDIHLVKIKYLPYLELAYFKNFTANEHVQQFLKDNGVNRRVGTLLLFIDDGVANDDPIFAVPINLSVVLKLVQDRAYAGFTASTGRSWEKHDILSWYWCDEFPCEQNEIFTQFDYHQQSRFSTAFHPLYNPGKGYGGGQADSVPAKEESPDTTPWADTNSQFLTDPKATLFVGANIQVPPNTVN